MEYGGCPQTYPKLGQRDLETQMITPPQSRLPASTDNGKEKGKGNMEPDVDVLLESQEITLPAIRKRQIEDHHDHSSGKHAKIVISHNNMHQGTIWTCSFCLTKFDLKTDLNRHVQEIHRKDVAPTPHEVPAKEKPNSTDPFEAITPNEFGSSRMDDNDDDDALPARASQQLICDICGDMFTEERLFTSHAETMHATATHGHSPVVTSDPTAQIDLMLFVCEMCGDMFSQEEWLTSHAAAEHPTTQNSDPLQKTYDDSTEQGVLTFLICDICEDVLSQEKLLSHLEEHANSTNTITASNEARAHPPPEPIEASSPTARNVETPFECDICRSQFTRMIALKKHKKCVHTQDKPFPCQICKKRFINKLELGLHHVLHMSEKPFACHKCQKQFFQKETLKQHFKQVHAR